MGDGFQDDVAETIDRCAAAVRDLDALRETLHELRLSSDPRAQFATALFDLDRARRGDPEARTTMLQVADALLAFWREGTGEELAAGHPELTRLWNEAASLLVTFEEKRLARLLQACWDAREDAALLKVAVADLQPDGYRRVEFARCLYHLELARLFEQESRAEFATRAGLLAEAYQDEAVANELIGDDAGLRHLWDELVPYLDEFFEHQERQAYLQSANQTTNRVPAVRLDDDTTAPVGRPLSLDAARSPEALADSHQVPSFRTLVGERAGSLPPPPITPPSGTPDFGDTDGHAAETKRVAALDTASVTTPKEATLAVAEPESEDVDVDVTPDEPVRAVARAAVARTVDLTPVEVPAAAPPPPPTDLTPPGAWKRPPDDASDDVVLDAELDAGPPGPPPPSANLTPPGSWFPPSTPSGEVELVDALEADAVAPPPPPPALTPAHGVRAADDVDIVEAVDASPPEPEPEPDDATLAFWAHTFETLQMAPGADGRAAQRLFATETRADRKRLVEYLDSLRPHLAVPEARAFACLVRLMLAAQTKEKGLFGQANPVRMEAVEAALALLAPTPAAAGHAAVWFELDGPETRETLAKGLDVVTRFLAYCHREQVDPLDARARHRFAHGDKSA